MKDLSPNEGGCWFCSKDEAEDFTFEWDSYVHDKCVREQALKGNPEAKIILREWGEPCLDCVGCHCEC